MDKLFNIAIDTSNEMSSSFYVAGNHIGSSVVEYLQILVQITNSAPEFTAGELASQTIDLAQLEEGKDSFQYVLPEYIDSQG